MIRLDTSVEGTNHGFGPPVPIQERDELIIICHPPETVRGIHNGDFFGMTPDLISAPHSFNFATRESDWTSGTSAVSLNRAGAFFCSVPISLPCGERDFFDVGVRERKDDSVHRPRLSSFASRSCRTHCRRRFHPARLGRPLGARCPRTEPSWVSSIGKPSFNAILNPSIVSTGGVRSHAPRPEQL